MHRKKASIVVNLIILAIGCSFLIALRSFPDQGAVKLYESAIYYPMLLGVLLVLFSVLSLWRDLFGADKDDKEIIDFTRLANYLLVIGTACGITAIWQVFEQFYIAAALGMGVLLYCLNPGESKKKKWMISAGVSIGFTVFIYLVFDLLLQVKL